MTVVSRDPRERLRFERRTRELTDAALAGVVTTPPGDEGDVLTVDSGKWVSAAPTGGGGGAPTDATYITQTASSGLSNEQALGALAGGILKAAATTGIVSIAQSGTDYLDALPDHDHTASAGDGGTIPSTSVTGLGTMAAVASPCPEANGGTGAASLAAAGLPVVVASFAAKGMATWLSKTTLLAAAPAGVYACAFTLDWVGDATGCYVTPLLYRTTNSNEVINYFSTPTSEAVSASVGASLNSDTSAGDGSIIVFTNDGGSDISISTMTTGGDQHNILFLLFRLPDAPSTAAKFYLNAIADTAVDAGATVTLDPAGPTFASGTEVTLTAHASSGYHFVEWQGMDGNQDPGFGGLGSNNPGTGWITCPEHITATFAADD